MLSEKPEYNKKIEMMHAMAPAVYLSHLKSPVIRFVASIIDSLYVRFLNCKQITLTIFQCLHLLISGIE